MAELIVGQLIKIIIGVVVVVAAVLGASMFFGVKVTDFFKGIPGFVDGECDPEKENCGEEEREEDETGAIEICDEIVHVNPTLPEVTEKEGGTITKTHDVGNKKGKVKITGKGNGIRGKMNMTIKIIRNEETIIKEEKEINLRQANRGEANEPYEISLSTNVQEEDKVEFEITRTKCGGVWPWKNCEYVKMQDFTITGCFDRCAENQDCEDDEYCSTSKKCKEQSCPEGNYCFEGNVRASEAKNHVCEGKEIKTCECGCSNGDCMECPTQTTVCTGCHVFEHIIRARQKEFIVKTKTEINLKDGTNKYIRVNEGKAKNSKGEIDPECSQWFHDGNENGIQEIDELCMTWGCKGDDAVRRSFELNENEKSGYEECKEKKVTFNHGETKVTFNHGETEYRVISENMIIRRSDVEQFRKIITGTTTPLSKGNEMPEITILKASNPSEETRTKMLTLEEPEEDENQKPCNTWFHDENTNEEKDDKERIMPDDWNCAADESVDKFKKNPPDSCSNLNHKYLTKYKKYEELMIEAIKSGGLECKLGNPRAVMAAFISVESDWIEDPNKSEKDYYDKGKDKEGRTVITHHTKRASWGLAQGLSYFDEIRKKYYLCAGWEVTREELESLMSRMIDYRTASEEEKAENKFLLEDVNKSLRCGARVMKSKMGHDCFKGGCTYECHSKDDEDSYSDIRYVGLKALARLYNGWPRICTQGNTKYVEHVFYEEGFYGGAKGKYYDWVACITQLDKEKGENPLENRNHCK